MDDRVRATKTFGFEPGRRLASKYEVVSRLGTGWEGEVYHVTEITTGVERAAKFFFPQRNPRDKAIKFYAKKLDKLRKCPIVIQYHTQEWCRCRGEKIAFLVSEYVEGQLLSNFIKQHPGKRVHYFEAMHLLYSLVLGLEEIHQIGEYHGDLHAENIIVKRTGIHFDVKVVDMFQWGRCTPAHFLDDVCDAIRLFYNAIGGAKAYSHAPKEVKSVVCGLKRSLIRKKFKTAGDLRVFLETTSWD
ncbi:MAG: hypothetical protein AMXMBFR84_00820 [Candidatus Hydrogenedentota bacterium]